MSVSLKTICLYPVAWEAELARGRLEAEGIPAFVLDGDISTVDPRIAFAGGGVKLQVPEDCVEAAFAILFPEELAKAKARERTRPRCPKCGSTKVSGFLPFWWLWLSLAFLLALVYPNIVRQRMRHCRDCGHKWRPSQEDAADNSSDAT